MVSACEHVTRLINLLTTRLHIKEKNSEQVAVDKQNLVKEFVRAASDGVRTALIDKRQSSWLKEEMPDQDEINRLMGVTC